MNEPRECRMIIATADIAGFSKESENKTDLDQFNMLNEFYALVCHVVGKAHGSVVKFLGDEALIVFPAAEFKEAVAALRELLAQAQTIWEQFDATCRLRINVHVGPLVCGPMGPERKFDVIGNVVNELFMTPHTDELHFSEDLQRLLGQ